MRSFFLIIFFAIKFSALTQSLISFSQYLTTNNQVLFVKTPSHTAVNGIMFLYERRNNHSNWKLIDSFAITVGRSGLANDVNSVIPFDNTAPIKQEGDGKSPSGIFKLGKVFSYHNINNLKMPFVQVDTNFYCVDDAASSYYNTLIKKDTAKHDFDSFEYMKRNDDFYEYGIWVLYNSNPVVKGNGSCIFLHVWQDEDSPTSGCTAMSKENMLKLIHWLDEKRNPVLLQLVGN